MKEMQIIRKFFLSCVVILLFNILISKSTAAVNCSDLYDPPAPTLGCFIWEKLGYCSVGEVFCDCEKYGTAEQIHCTQVTYPYYGCLGGDGGIFAPHDGKCTKKIDSTYANGGICTCCTAGKGCDDCTPPQCPDGYTPINPNNYCTDDRRDVSCDNGEDDCGDDCNDNKTKCYLKETNISFIQKNGEIEGPTSVSIIVDGETFVLSADPNNPTPIKLPASGSSNVQVTMPTFTAPATSRGANYVFQVNNYGVNNQWKPWVSCSGTIGEDFCTTLPNSNNTQIFAPTSLTVNQVLKEGAIGQISAQYATTDKCTDTYKYSTARVGYYKVDTTPDPIPDPDPDPDPINIFPDIVTDRTPKGCSSTTYTGQDINNPLHVVANIRDIDGNNEVQALTLWFSKDTSKPAVGTITGTYSGSSNQDLGIMIRKNGTSWSIYVTNTDNTWARITNGYIKVNGSNIARIYDVSVTQGTNVTFDYKIEFLTSAENLSGRYHIYGGGLDSYMINGNTIDQSYFSLLTNWGIDLVRPTVNDIIQNLNTSATTYITWGATDTISGIGRTLINAYRTGGTTNGNLTLYLPTAYTTSKGTVRINSEGVPDLNNIGRYDETNAWIFNTPSGASNVGEKDLLNIGSNEEGNIILYSTPYDLACNTDSASVSINLDPWFATRGGGVYSFGNISSSAKDVSLNTNLDGVFNSKTGMTKERVDLGTELLSTRNVNISNLVHSSVGAVRTLVTEDANNQKNYWYTLLYNKFEKQRENLTYFTIPNSCTGTNCYTYSTEDIHIPQSYTCAKPTLIISEKNIYIEPNINSGTGFSGCIFLAKNNIYVGAGSHLSDTKIKYDYIDGFLIADNQIIFPLVDQTSASNALRDGIEVYGGLVAFGSKISDGASAISIERNMRLLNQTNPTLVVTYDNRYANLSYIFFGTSVQLYKQEVGFKTGD